MKNFKGLHKCATGAVVNTEDFMKSSNLGTSMLEWPRKPKKNKIIGGSGRPIKKGQYKGCSKGQCVG